MKKITIVITGILLICLSQKIYSQSTIFGAGALGHNNGAGTIATHYCTCSNFILYSSFYFFYYYF